MLKAAFVSPFRTVRRAPPKRLARVAKRRKRVARSQDAVESQRIQGQYLGYLRQIPEARRTKYKSIALKDGREKAIEAMRKVLGK